MVTSPSPFRPDDHLSKDIMTDWTQVPADHPVWIEGETKGKFFFSAVEKNGRLRISGGNNIYRSRSVDPALVTLRTTYLRPKK